MKKYFSLKKYVKWYNETYKTRHTVNSFKKLGSLEWANECDGHEIVDGLIKDTIFYTDNDTWIEEREE